MPKILTALAVPIMVVAVMFAVIPGCSRDGTTEQADDAATPTGDIQTAALETGEPLEKETEPTGAGRGMTAIMDAAGAEKYLFVFFYKDGEDEQTRKMRKVFDGAVRRIADRAEMIAINVSDPSEKEVVEKFGAGRAPMPLVLAIAPNGAITGGFPTEFDEQRIVNAVAGPSMEECLKALQDRKLVLLCVQNGSTRLNDEAMQGVRDFKADPRYTRSTTIVMLDPADRAEAKTLESLDIDPETEEAITLLLAPPGSALAKFNGETNKNMLVATLNRANSGCGPGGCGPGGCGPKKK